MSAYPDPDGAPPFWKQQQVPGSAGAGTAASADGAEKLRGTIEKTIFQNAESGFTVARLRPEGGGVLVTVAGILYGITEEQEVCLVGRWQEHRKYGRQFTIEDVAVEAPTSRRGLIRYLGAGTVPGIGRRLAERIVDKFGERTLEVLDQHIEELRQVEGIGRKKLGKIREAWGQHREQREAFIFLQGLGIGPGTAARIHREWRSSCIQRIQENPYGLTSFPGIGFKRADAIALQLGVELQDPRRLAAGIVYVLRELVDSGHTCYPREPLIERASRILACATELAETTLTALLADRHLLAEPESPEHEVFLPDLHEAEQEVATRLVHIARGLDPRGLRLPDSDGGDDPIPHLGAAVLCTGIGIALDPHQEEAVRMALVRRLTVITGGPGVGKTTVVRAIVDAARHLGWEVRLAAPTGRAAKRLEEATHQQASTLHRLLKWDPIGGTFQHDARDPLEGQLFVVDETSMVDTFLMQSFLRAVPARARVVLVGDADQLPSVGPGEVLRDVIDAGVAGVVRLQRIFRQAAGGLIVENAHRINTGEMPQLPPPSALGDGALADFYFVHEEDPERARELILKLVTERIPQRFGFDPMRDIQVMAPMYRGACGTDSLNEHLGKRLNSEGRPLLEGAAGAADSVLGRLRTGDRVMQTTNDYDRDIYNGDLGRLVTWDAEAKEATVRFDERDVTMGDDALRNLVPAYAISIHKSQGSEYPAVVIPLLTEHYIMLRRRLLYTAVTRGKRLVVLVGSRRALGQAVRAADGDTHRHTRLAQRLREAQAVLDSWERPQ